MADLKGALLMSGSAKLGVAVSGAEREASLRRGGDGLVGQFDDGVLADVKGTAMFAKSPRSMSLCIRLRDPSGKWRSPIFQKAGPGKPFFILEPAQTRWGPSLAFDLRTDWGDQPIQVAVPLSLIGMSTWHDVIIRYTGAKLEMFVNGALVDENWPIGVLPRSELDGFVFGSKATNGVAGFHGLIDHAAVWNRALTDDEVVFLSGGKEEVAKRRKEMFGDPPESMQYWKPPGYNTNVGDCMPFFHDGTFHLYYLFDRRHHGSKYGMGGHQWAHASSRDLVHWTQHPLAIAITDQREASICTGSMLFHDGKYYAYYATRMADRSGERLSKAVSSDGIHFTKTEPNPFAAPGPGYGTRDYRDPKIFRDERTGQFHLLVTARLADARGGCLAHLESPDQVNWKLDEPFLVPGFVPECADHFFWNGWYYLISTRYWMSKNPLGPWTAPAAPDLDVLYVPKTAEFTGNRRLMVSWLPEGGWGGCAVFRELVQHKDGTLGTKWPAEMIPATGEKLKMAYEYSYCELAPGGCGSVYSGLPANARIRCKIEPGKGKGTFSLRMRRGKDDGSPCNELLFNPAKRTVEIVKGAALKNVGGLDKPFTVDVILKDDILDVCIGDDHTLIGRVPRLKGDRIDLYADRSGVKFSDLDVRKLK